MLSKSERAQANHHLKSHGFGGLDDRNIMDQLALMVRDHKHFRSVLMTTNPLERKACYDSLAPRLNFKAKPLEDYIAEAKLDAEIRQLPNYDPKTLQVRPFEVPEVHTDGFLEREEMEQPEISESQIKLTDAANWAINADLNKEAGLSQLILTCTECGIVDEFWGRTAYLQTVNADSKGWKSPRKGEVLCPNCSTVRKEAN
jgi:hypothetical protein